MFYLELRKVPLDSWEAPYRIANGIRNRDKTFRNVQNTQNEIALVLIGMFIID